MSFPGEKTQDPWKMAQAVENASFVQDVILATTRLIHEGTLKERERAALVRCRGLLRSADSGDAGQGAVVEDPALEPTESASLLRAARAALPEDPTSFQETLRVLDLVLEGGKPDETDLELIVDLREMFLAIGRANLESINAARQSEGDLGPWAPLTTSSLS